MFLPEPTPGDLRQGDILAPIVFPRWDLGNYYLSGKVEPNARANLAVTDVMMLDHIAAEESVMNVVKHATPLRFMICSHDCDFDKAEIKNRAGILVAPLVPRPDTHDQEAINKLRASANRDMNDEYDFIHLFPVELPGETDFVVADFSAMMAVGSPGKIKKQLIQMRELEMTEEGRRLLRRKLAAFFGREQEPHEGAPSSQETSKHSLAPHQEPAVEG